MFVVENRFDAKGIVGLWVVDDTVDAEGVAVEGAVVSDIIVGVVTVEVGVPEDDGLILDLFFSYSCCHSERGRLYLLTTAYSGQSSFLSTIDRSKYPTEKTNDLKDRSEF